MSGFSSARAVARDKVAVGCFMHTLTLREMMTGWSAAVAASLLWSWSWLVAAAVVVTLMTTMTTMMMIIVTRESLLAG